MASNLLLMFCFLRIILSLIFIGLSSIGGPLLFCNEPCQIIQSVIPHQKYSYPKMANPSLPCLLCSSIQRK